MVRVYIVGSLLVCGGAGYLYRHAFNTAKTLPYRTEQLSFKSYCYLFSVACFLLASRQLPLGQITSSADGNGIDIIILLDVSQSMLVQDLPKQTSRILGAKELISTLLQKTTQARRGVGIFAGEVQGILPLTQDLNLVRTFLAGVDHRNLTKQGTSVAEAIQRGASRFDTENPGGNVLIVLSDGGEEEVVLPTSTKQFIKEQEISVFLIGIGTRQGGPIITGVDFFGNPILKQRQGTPVISTLQEDQLQNIANQINGTYLHGTETTSKLLDKKIKKIPTKPQAGQATIEQRTLTSFFTLCGLFAVLLAIGITPMGNLRTQIFQKFTPSKK